MTSKPGSEAGLSRGPIEGSTLFSTPICSATLAQATELNESLTETILERAGREVMRGAAHGLLPWGFPGLEVGAVHTIVMAARTMASKLVEARGQGAIPLTGWRVSWRAQVLFGRGAATPVSEPETDFAGIYMVAKSDDATSPGSGGLLEFQDPRGPAPVMYAPFVTFQGPGADSLGVTQTLSMKPGLLIVYPAFLPQSFSFYRGASPHITLRLRIKSSDTE